MSTIELILALAGLCLFASFVLGSEGRIIAALNLADADLQEKRSAVLCAAELDFFYAHAGGKTGHGKNCTLAGAYAAAQHQKSPVIFTANAPSRGGAGIVLQVQRHYG